MYLQIAVDNDNYVTRVLKSNWRLGTVLCGLPVPGAVVSPHLGGRGWGRGGSDLTRHPRADVLPDLRAPDADLDWPRPSPPHPLGLVPDLGHPLQRRPHNRYDVPHCHGGQCSVKEVKRNKFTDKIPPNSDICRMSWFRYFAEFQIPFFYNFIQCFKNLSSSLALQDLSLSLSVMSWVASLCLALAYVITLWLLPDIKVKKYIAFYKSTNYQDLHLGTSSWTDGGIF